MASFSDKDALLALLTEPLPGVECEGSGSIETVEASRRVDTTGEPSAGSSERPKPDREAAESCVADSTGSSCLLLFDFFIELKKLFLLLLLLPSIEEGHGERGGDERNEGAEPSIERAQESVIVDGTGEIQLPPTPLSRDGCMRPSEDS